MDVDGTLTDGTITYAEDGSELKSFHARDGAGIKLLARVGIVPAIVSGRTSAVTARRARELGIESVDQGVADKAAAVAALRRRLGVSADEVAFIGDDLSDLPAMREAGFSAAPADAAPEVRRAAGHVCEARGGHGAVREAIEVLLKRQGLWDAVLREHGALAGLERTGP
jgi:3-deoxy-D-manno-octulosonate 8-phosphate phosphatase (KDO 8-P phosphatase)